MRHNDLQEIGEFGLIKRIAGRTRRKDPFVQVGIGDDAAVITPSSPAVSGKRTGRLLITTDSLVEDVHFRRNSPPDDLGWKALAVNISDIAAMGGVPRHYLVAISIPPSLSVEYLDSLFAGMKDAADRYGLSLIGGDTTSSPDRIYISITVLGETSDGAVLRNGARPGDNVFVTGTLGDSALGLRILEKTEVRGQRTEDRYRTIVKRHLRPTPRVKEGIILAKSGMVNSMIDVSDGLLADLGHICEESGVGARINVDKLPLSKGFRMLSTEYGGLELALSGGEDYELLFTGSPLLPSFLEKTKGVKYTAIGEIVKEKGIAVSGADGSFYAIKGTGYDHFRRK